MNRTDRLYAIVEDLRSVAPASRTAPVLAARFEVSVRTVERDIAALQQAGVPIYATPGRRGGYAVDRAMTLPPVNFTPAEAAAVALALARAGSTPLRAAARTALPKMMAAMTEVDAGAARRLASRIRLYQQATVADGPPPAPPVVEEAIVAQLVVVIDYEDKTGARTNGWSSRWWSSAWSPTGTWRRGVGCARRCAASASTGSTGPASPARWRLSGEIDPRALEVPDMVPGPPLLE